MTPALLSAPAALAMTGGALAQATPQAAAPPPQHNCVMSKLSACMPDGTCKALDTLKGEKLPVKVTVDFETGIVAGVDPDGWVNATRIGAIAHTGDRLMLQGVDSEVAWQMLIYKDKEMSFSLATGDDVSIGFGECTVPAGP